MFYKHGFILALGSSGLPWGCMFNHILANSGTTGPFYYEKQIICSKHQLPCLENKQRACAGKSYALPHLFSRKILWSLIPLHWISSWVDMLWAQVFFLFLFFFSLICSFSTSLVNWSLCCCSENVMSWSSCDGFSEQFMKMWMCSFLQPTPRSPRSILYPINVLSDDEALISVCEGDGGH